MSQNQFFFILKIIKMCRAWNKKIKTNIKYAQKLYLYVGIPQFFTQPELCIEILKIVSISENMFRHILIITTREPVRINSEVKQDLMWVFFLFQGLLRHLTKLNCFYEQIFIEFSQYR